ncbi:MAG: Nramp family divalent metal transporter [Bacteroidia bacterium]|nr:Nramp family divalent metal transporter [Bacteroidia bacterium]
MWRNIGPGVLIAAAFIGPGTVTVCTLAGVQFGYSLLWAMLLAMIAAVVLQEMAARLGIVTQEGLAANIRKELKTPWVRVLVLGLILAAIVLGNMAYEAGNIGGATLGLDAMFGTAYSVFYPWLIGAVAFTLLYIGSYKTLEKVFVFLVILMSLSFLITALLTAPNLIKVGKGLLLPSVPEQGTLTIIALIGTTVVPYNLFLHASLVKEKWKGAEALQSARKDTLITIFLGGIVSMAIIVAAAAIPGKSITSAMDLAQGLEPLFGKGARYGMGIGLFAAGVTSSITAPLAAAYVTTNCMGWSTDMKDSKFRSVWILVLLIGVLTLSFDVKPIQVIQFAQVANGIVLPLVAIFLLWIVNRKQVMGFTRNTKGQNMLAILVLLLIIFLASKSVLKVIG